MANNNNDNTLLKIGGAIAAYFIIVKPVLEKLGLQKSADVLATEKKNKDLIDQYIIQTQKTQKPTKSDSEWKIIADQIYADLRYSALDDNKDDAGYQVCRVKNDADVALLFKYFAKRREYLFGIPSGGLQNLTQFIVSNLSKAKIAAINKNYASKSIKFRF